MAERLSKLEAELNAKNSKIESLTLERDSAMAQVDFRKTSIKAAQESYRQELDRLKNLTRIKEEEANRAKKELSVLKQEVDFSKSREQMLFNEKIAAKGEPKSQRLPISQNSDHYTPGKYQSSGLKRRNLQDMSSEKPHDSSRLSTPDSNSSKKSLAANKFADGFSLDGLPMKRKLAATVANGNYNEDSFRRLESAARIPSEILDLETSETAPDSFVEGRTRKAQRQSSTVTTVTMARTRSPAIIDEPNPRSYQGNVIGSVSGKNTNSNAPYLIPSAGSSRNSLSEKPVDPQEQLISYNDQIKFLRAELEQRNNELKKAKTTQEQIEQRLNLAQSERNSGFSEIIQLKRDKVFLENQLTESKKMERDKTTKENIQVEKLNRMVAEGLKEKQLKQEILEFTERLFNHQVYRNVEPSWKLLSTWKITDFGSTGTQPISHVLEKALYGNASFSGLESLSLLLQRFFEESTNVIFHLYKQEKYRPIPIILELIYFCVSFHPDCVLLGADLVSFLSRYLDAHSSYLRQLPDSDQIHSLKYNPFKLGPTSYRGKGYIPDSTIVANNAFKELSVLYTLDILGKMAANVGYLSKYSYVNVWSNVSMKLIFTLASPKAPSNIVHKLITFLLPSITEHTIGSISLEPSKMGKLHTIEKNELFERLRSNTPSGLPSRQESRSTSPADNNLERNEINTTTDDIDLSTITNTDQSRNEHDLIMLLAHYLVTSIPCRHTLLFSSLDDIPLPSTSSKSDGDFKRWNTIFRYICYSDVNSLYANTPQSEALSGDGLTKLLDLHEAYGGPRKYYNHLSQINEATTIHIRKAIIKFYLETALVRSARLIIGNRNAMTALSRCVATYLDHVIQSINPDQEMVGLIGDCVNLLYCLFNFIDKNPYSVGSDIHNTSNQGKDPFGIKTDKHGKKRWKAPVDILLEIFDEGYNLIAAMTLITNSRNVEAVVAFDEAELLKPNQVDDKQTANGPTKTDTEGDVAMNDDDDDDIEEITSFDVPLIKSKPDTPHKIDVGEEGGEEEEDVISRYTALSPPLFDSSVAEKAQHILKLYYYHQSSQSKIEID